MSECHFTTEQAHRFLGNVTYNAYTLIAQMENACREIIRLNEVIEGMKRANEIKICKEYYSISGEPGKYYCTIHHCELQQVRPGKWQCPECE